MDQQQTQPGSISTKRPALRIALAAFFVTVLVAGIAFIVARSGADEAAGIPDDQPNAVNTTVPKAALNPQDGAAVLVGQSGTVVGGPGTVPDRIDFNADGTYRVVDSFATVHSGVYSVQDDTVTFDVRPEEDDVLWIVNDVQLRNVQHCQEMSGTYTVEFGSGSTVTLRVVTDPCVTRITVANGIELELREL